MTFLLALVGIYLFWCLYSYAAFHNDPKIGGKHHHPLLNFFVYYPAVNAIVSAVLVYAVIRDWNRK